MPAAANAKRDVDQLRMLQSEIGFAPIDALALADTMLPPDHKGDA
jgi:hypothetical protein